MPLLTAEAGVAIAFTLASRIGFPLPFTISISSPGVCFFAAWGQFLRHHREVRRDVVHYYVLIIKQASLIYIYAVFSSTSFHGLVSLHVHHEPLRARRYESLSLSLLLHSDAFSRMLAIDR